MFCVAECCTDCNNIIPRLGMFILILFFRKSTLQNILQTIQFIRMPPKFLQDIKPQLVDGLGLCKDKIKSAQALQTESPEQLDIWANDRREHARDVIYLFSSGSNEVDRFDEVQNTFVPCPQLRIPRKERGQVRYAVRVDKYLFLVSSRSVLRWNQFTFDWEYFGEGETAEAIVDSLCICDITHSKSDF